MNDEHFKCQGRATSGTFGQSESDSLAGGILAGGVLLFLVMLAVGFVVITVVVVLGTLILLRPVLAAALRWWSARDGSTVFTETVWLGLAVLFVLVCSIGMLLGDELAAAAYRTLVPMAMAYACAYQLARRFTFYYDPRPEIQFVRRFFEYRRAVVPANRNAADALLAAPATKWGNDGRKSLLSRASRALRKYIDVVALRPGDQCDVAGQRRVLGEDATVPVDDRGTISDLANDARMPGQ